MPLTRAKRSRAVVVQLTTRAHERLIGRALANGHIASAEATLLLETLLEREASLTTPAEEAREPEQMEAGT
jgi:hypothetical protein